MPDDAETLPPPRGYRDGVRSVLPLSVAVLAFGVTFGVLAREVGMGRVAPIVMSATTFAGSAQFGAASILGAGGGTATAIVAAALLNARYGPIGVSVAPWVEGSVLTRFLHAQLIVDESWAIASEGDGRWNPRVLLGAGAVLYLAWVVGTTVGVAFGDLIGDPSSWGLDAAFPALFLALLAPQIRARLPRAAAAAGAAIGLALTPLLPAGVPIVAAAAACLLGLLPRRGPDGGRP